jgi:hypothetical protein
LAFSDAAIPEENHLHLVFGLGPKVELGKIGAQPGEAVVNEVVREDLPRHSDGLVGRNPDEAWVVCKGSKESGRDREPAAVEVETLKSLQPSQRGEVRGARARQVEVLKSLESSQRGEVHDTRARQIEVLKSLESSQRGKVRDARARQVEGLKSSE